MKRRTISLYQVDAFTNKVFGGNPAAVCILDEWLPEKAMQQIAAENNLAETAFAHCDDKGIYHIRWFTPTVEVDLCGHATLATAFVLYEQLAYQKDYIHFYSHRSGDLKVFKTGNQYCMDFPADVLESTEITTTIEQALKCKPQAAYVGNTDLLLVFDDQETIENMNPDLYLLNKIDVRGVIVTAPGKTCDFVSRFFGPQCGIDEDPVTGSAHTSLIPYWAERMNKNEFTAFQLSKRGGRLCGVLKGDRVFISGEAVLYLKGEFYCE